MIRSITYKRISTIALAFFIITQSVTHAQVEIKVPSIKRSVKFERGNKNSESTKGSSSQKTNDTAVEINERPKCAEYSEQKVTRFRGKLDDMKARLETEFRDNSFVIAMNSLERDYKSVKNSLTNCQKDNPNYDFSKELQNIDNALADYDIFYAAYEAKTNQGDQSAETLRMIQTCASGMDYFPGNSFDDDFLALSANDVAPFIDPKDDGSSLYSNVFLRGNNDIKHIEAYLNSSDFTEKAFGFLDRMYSEPDKSEGIEEIQLKIRDLGQLKALFFPENTNLNDVLAYATKLESKLLGNQNQALKEIAVSDFHMSNVNTIKFTSNINLDPRSATESDFKTDFTAGDQIKAIVYLDQALKDYSIRNLAPEFRLKSASNSNHFTIEGFKTADWSLGYVEFYISLDAANYTPTKGTPCETAISMDFLGDLPPRKHSIEVTLLSGKEPTATLTFDADNDEGLKKMESEKMLIRDKHLADKPLPVAKMKNATYESQLLSMFNDIGWEETFKKTIILSSDWGYEKNYEGVVIGRTLSVAMVSTKNGACMYQEFTVIQDKVGSNYGSFKIHGTGGQSDISCSKVR